MVAPRRIGCEAPRVRPAMLDSRRTMPAVLYVAEEDRRPELSKTVLGRADIEWLSERSADTALATASARLPALVIIALVDRAVSESLVRRLRQDTRTRHLPVVVVLPSPLPPDEEALRAVGADAVLAGAPDPFRWNQVLDTLLNVPSRGGVRIPVLFWTWFRLGDEEPRKGKVLDLSAQGMLLETPHEVELGTRIEAKLTLPLGREVTVVAEIVRDAGSRQDRWLYGLVFRGLAEEPRRQLEAFVREATP